METTDLASFFVKASKGNLHKYIYTTYTINFSMLQLSTEPKNQDRQKEYKTKACRSKLPNKLMT